MESVHTADDSVNNPDDVVILALVSDKLQRPAAPGHDPLLCGLSGYDGPPPCPACAAEGTDVALMARWPQLARVAPGAHNAIAGSAEEQLRRAIEKQSHQQKKRAKPKRKLTRRQVARIVRDLLAAELPEALPIALSQMKRRRSNGQA
jgi:hypothetical protein